MPIHKVKNKQEIKKTIDFLVSRKHGITIQIKGEETPFTIQSNK